MKNGISQKEAIFYQLYARFKSKNTDYLPVHALMGEVYCKELNRWGYVSYECSARASEMITENPGLLMRTRLTGKSGARYYGYRISPAANIELIKDPRLLTFYRKISGNKDRTERDKMLAENKKRVEEFDKEWEASRAAKKTV